ncbi:ATP-grasp domain-containing protein [Lacrimispora sp. 210928-DFI.3.58]|uniref:ATP-grasp domain-containing protein n=1 Tax=Lacrimispora sp. 210928-DFI.3.58 TaxID=2883214 RepID=UPI001D07B5F7|nr:ATP-grasp domain-containing protein [Lacrimispora sp. 210928-DFI.3.58]MCB7319859.1 ATP-grasp domain-containing protein [Lacrimispora sp. 210928-DFI.3.58]
MKKLMILGAGILQLPAIEKANEMGLQVIAVDMNPEAIGFKVQRVIKEVISTIDTSAILEAAKRHQIDGIMTLASDMPMRSVAVVSKELNLVGITEDTAIKATNKAVMREALKKAEVPIPMFFRVADMTEYKKAVKEMQNRGMRCIIKPTDNSGSRGIVLLKDFEDRTIEGAFEYSRKSSRSGELMVEEYMDGPEVSVETLSVDGRCEVIQITDKLTTGSPYFVEMGHNEPSMLSDNIKRQIEMITVAANHAIGIENGPSHTEIKITSSGPKIVELGARLGGDNITTHLVPLSTGVDMVECCIKIALGQKPDVKKKFSKGAAIRYFRADHGRITGIQGVDNAKRIEGIKQVSIVHGVGEMLHGIRSSVDRAGFVIAQGEDAEHAVSLCEKALNLISVEVIDDV